ncbi:hypothetical protein L2E82_45184 [Cichorium intybus]|uniref:Uncharacterized protein n=1 Tax=Cichorium intybus TaxID=13427 RepID=A0ACB8ZS60_CICIN|nr:hypothetical protein L2E82_45184 [Cichorium intybus]
MTISLMVLDEKIDGQLVDVTVDEEDKFDKEPHSGEEFFTLRGSHFGENGILLCQLLDWRQMVPTQPLSQLFRVYQEELTQRKSKL